MQKLKVRFFLRALVLLEIALVAWDTIGLMESFGFRRAQHDGIFYLAAAQSFLRGEGPYTFPHRCEVAIPYRWIYEWPLGYSFLIAAESYLSGLPPFYVSRWGNLFFYVLAYAILRIGFRQQAEWLFLTLFSPNVSWIVGFVISEAPYLVLWIASVVAAEKLLQKACWIKAMGLAGLLVALFLLRYNGLVVGAAVGLIGLWYVWKGNTKYALLLFFPAAMQAVIAAAYFAWNAYHEPLGYSGLRMYPPLPSPEGWLRWLLGEAHFVRYAAVVGVVAAFMHLWAKNQPATSNFPFPLSAESITLLLITAFGHAGLYISGMLQERIGILDERHLFPILMPFLWIAWLHIGQRLPSMGIVLVAVGMVGWQARNILRHAERASREGALFPYTFLDTVRKAYDTLPPHSCVLAANLAYAIVAQRRDLCFPDADASYGLLTCQRCEHVYVDCAAIEERVQMGLAQKPYGVAWRACDEPARGLIDLRRYPCEKSP